VLAHHDGSRFAVSASHADERLTLKPVLAPGETLASIEDGQAVDTAITGPFEIKVFKITNS
jgi:hypothetical protein